MSDRTPVVHGAKSGFVMDRLPAKRQKSGIVYTEGERFVTEALAGDWERLELVLRADLADGSEGKAWQQRARAAGVKLHLVDDAGIRKLTATENPQPVGIFLKPRFPRLDNLSHHILVLDAVADPGNAGTLVRTAAAFGFAVVMIGGVRATNEKFIRASAGMCFRNQTLLGELDRDAASVLLKNHDVYLLEPEAGIAVEAITKSERVALVLGNEGAGVDPKHWPKAKGIVIPMRPGVESLNVSISGAIAMYEFAK